MAGNPETPLVNEMEQAAVDPWVAAFAALDKKDEKDIEGSANTGDGNGSTSVQGGDSDLSDTHDTDKGEGSSTLEGGDSPVPTGELGGSGDLGGADGTADAGFDWDDIDVSEEALNSRRDAVTKEIEEQTIRDVAAAYINKGARNSNGRLGATIDDPDICKRDRDGVPRFYNPETGREFTGDNPRRQAQEWVDDYNRMLRDNFNQTCQQYSQQLLSNRAPELAVMEFAPKWKALDPVRRQMLESIIEDYEVTNSDGDVIGYSCDLNKALGQVERLISRVQRHYASTNGGNAVTQQQQPAAASGPALDTPSAGGGKGDTSKPNFKSLAEAMEWQQDQLLASRRK